MIEQIELVIAVVAKNAELCTKRSRCQAINNSIGTVSSWSKNP
jgi:hypothetical protein